MRHIEFDRNRKPSTVRDYASQTGRYLLDEFGADLPLSELTTERIEEWQQEMLERGHLARRTIQKAQVCLHSILKRAKKKRWVERNAAEDADRITLKPSGDFNVLSVEEAEALIRAAADETDAAIFCTAISCGRRLGSFARCAGATSTSRAAHPRALLDRATRSRVCSVRPPYPTRPLLSASAGSAAEATLQRHCGRSGGAGRSAGKAAGRRVAVRTRRRWTAGLPAAARLLSLSGEARRIPPTQ